MPAVGTRTVVTAGRLDAGTSAVAAAGTVTAHIPAVTVSAQNRDKIRTMFTSANLANVRFGLDRFRVSRHASSRRSDAEEPSAWCRDD